jgi:glycosyltransferase involved in cell wall biosynthesis
MNILLVADVSIAGVIGGAERVLFEQSIHLVQRGHDVHILTRALPGREKHNEVIQGVREWRYNVVSKPAITFLKTTRQNSRSLFESLQDKNHFNLIVLHQPFSALGVIQSALSKKIKKIYICHSLSFEEYISRNEKPKGLYGKILYGLNILARKWIEKRVLNSSDEIIALSQFTKEKLIKVHKIPNQKISIIPGGVDLFRFRPTDSKKEIRCRLQIPEEKVILFSVRNLVQRMGLENLIDAISIVITKIPDIYLVIGGDGPLKDKLMEMVRGLGIEESIRFEGFIPKEILPDYYKMADLFILPTLELEGFGLVTIESMASGVPVLGTPVGGTKEILGKFNPKFLFKDTTSDSLAALIIVKYQIIKENPEEWQEISLKCRHFVENNYSWEKHVDALEKYF